MYESSDAAIGETRRIRVVCLGAGYSGLMMAIAVREKLSAEDLDFQVYEKNADLGGTWLLNRYRKLLSPLALNLSKIFCSQVSWLSM